jgi:predicted nucleotidyltransferase component of viral defense system
MKLHENRELLQDAILATSQLKKIPEIYIEKDYWVTLALYEIFHSNMANESVFKGGTALSKCHKLIERFSEDIDVVVLRNEGETDNQLKQKLRKLSKIVEKTMPEIEIIGITNKKGNIRKTAHEYNKIYNGNFGQVREHVILEASWLGNFEPFTTETVSSFITEMMNEKGQHELIEQYRMHPFQLKVLSKERTLCEKIMSLVRFSRQENPYYDLSNKIRHIYDIHMMLMNKEVSSFFESKEFYKMMIKVGKDDVISYVNNNDWLQEHPSKSIIFEQPEETWNKIKLPYQTTFPELVFGILPSETELIHTLKKLAKQLKTLQ